MGGNTNLNIEPFLSTMTDPIRDLKARDEWQQTQRLTKYKDMADWQSQGADTSTKADYQSQTSS